jgi:hypothetical protein
MSVDPGNAGADLTNPQSWNMYGYVRNNPLVFVDPDGLATAVPCNSNGVNPNDGSTICDSSGSSGGNLPIDCFFFRYLCPGGTGEDSVGTGDDGGGPNPGVIFRVTVTATMPQKQVGNLGLTSRGACFADAVVNGAGGLVPGYNALKAGLSFLGVNFNFVQAFNADTSWPVTAGSPTGPQALAGLASTASIHASWNYAYAGGDAALKNLTKDRASFALQTAGRQTKLLREAASLERLASMASAAKNLSLFVSLASTAYDLYQCSQKP